MDIKEIVMNIEEILEYSSTNKDTFNDVVNNIGNVIPFVGAGMSAFCYPTWGGFLTQVLKSHEDLFEQSEIEEISLLISNNKYEDIADKLEEVIGHNFFIKDVTRTYAKNNIDILDNQPINKLSEIFEKAVITTNFDKVLEEVYINNPFNHIVYPGQKNVQARGIQNDEHFLFKLHGDIIYTDSIILTKKQYEDNYGKEEIDLTKELPNLLLNIFRSRQMLFLGCSLEEDRTMKVLDALTNKVPGLAHFAFMQKPSEKTRYRKINATLNRHSIYPIWYPEGKYECIGILLDEMAKKVKKKY